jgi:hypothetical protein
MKKIIIATALVTAMGIASALEVGVSEVRDYHLHANGSRISLAASPIGNLTPQVSITHVSKQFNQYAIGGDYAVTKVGPIALAVTAAGVYQDTTPGAKRSDGYALSYGVKATVELAKDISVVAGIERLSTQNRISAFAGNSAVVGVQVKL